MEINFIETEKLISDDRKLKIIQYCQKELAGALKKLVSRKYCLISVAEVIR